MPNASHPEPRDQQFMVGVRLARIAIVLTAVSALAGCGASTAPAPSPRDPATVPTAARQLVSMLAVLRRPQTAADRAVPASELRFLQANEGPIVSTLTRLVTTADGARFFVFVTKPSDAIVPRQAPLWAASLGDRVFVTNATGSAPEIPVPAAELRDPYLASSWYVARSPKQYFVEIVPDGVTRARLVFRTGTVYAPVSHNTVVALAPPSSNEDLRSVTWYAPGGRVLPALTLTTDATLHTAVAARAAAIRAALIRQDAKLPNRAPSALLGNFAVFAADTERPVRAHGITISHPTLSSLPPTVLEFVNDPREMRAVLTRSGLRFWIDPGPLSVSESPTRVRELTYVCLRQQSNPSTASCSLRLAAVLARGLWDAGRLVDGTAVIYGIVPDTNRTVTLRLPGGGARTVPVVHGVVVTPANGVTEILVKGVDRKLATVRAPKVAT